MAASLACSLAAPRPAATGTAPATTVTPGPASATLTPAVAQLDPTQPPAPAPSATPEDQGAPRALLDAVREAFHSGGLERGAAIAAGLRVVVGEARAEDVFGPGSLPINEATGLIRLGKRYLETGDDPAAQAEIQRLLNRLLPPLDALDRFARPLPGQAAGPVASHRARPPAQTACEALWEGGFTSPETAICFEYATRVIGGVTHRVYVPAAWPADDPRRAQLDLALAALEDSLAVYNALGPGPVMASYIVMTDLAGLDDEGRPDPDMYAAAEHPGGTEVCRVGVFPTGAALDEAGFQQNLAHELFHCYQFTNLRAQERGPDPDDNVWWIEGTAEYFSNVVYPSTNLEFDWAAGFDETSPDTSLLGMSYDNYLFWMHLADQGGLGNDGVIQLLQSMPISGDFIDQQDALANWPGMDDLFYQFARDYLDRQLQDTGGGLVPVNPVTHEPHTFLLGGGSLDFSAPAFTVARYRLFWEPRGDFSMAPTAGEGTRHTARPTGEPGAWADLPTTMRSSCELADYLLLTTSTQPAGGFDARLTIAYSAEEGEECDACLVGHWTQDIASLRPVMEQFLPAGTGMNLETLEGTFHLNVFDNGTFEYRSEGYVLQYARPSDDGTDTFRYDNELLSIGAWGSADNTTLTTFDTDSTIRSLLTATVNGNTRTQPLEAGGPGYAGPFAADSSFPYVCTEDTLTVYPAPGQAVPFTEWVYTKAP